MKKKPNIELHKRRWSNVSLLYVVQQMREFSYRGSYIKESLVLRRRSDYFYIEQPPGNTNIFIPDSSVREQWDILCIFFILYQNFIIMFLLSYTHASAYYHYIILTVIDFLFICEMLLNFNTGYFADGVLVKYRVKIFKTYLKTLLIFDVLACIPLQLFISEMQFDPIPNTNLSVSELLKSLWILKLLNNKKLFKILHNFQSRLSSELLYSLQYILRFIISALILIHWMTCLIYYFFLKDFYNDGMKWYEIYDKDVNVYLRFCYMMVFTATSVGFGDIVPFTLSQKILCICVMALSCWQFAFILTNIKEIFLKYNSVNNYYKGIIFQLKKISKQKNFSKNLRIRTLSYLRYLKENTKKRNYGEEKILKILSGPLKEEVFVVTRGNILHKCPVFMHYSQDFLRFLIRNLDHSIFAPSDTLFKEGEKSNTIYFILSGRIEIYHESTQTSFKELEVSKYFGEIGFFLGTKRVASARALVFSELFLLSGFKMENLLRTKRNDLEIHKIFVVQCKQNMGLLGVKCYLCLKSGHIAKDCKKFVIVINQKELAKKANDKKYEFNKTISDIRNYQNDSNKLDVQRYSKEMTKGSTKSIKNRFKYSELLKSKCELYLKEEKITNYKKAAKRKKLFEIESDASVECKTNWIKAKEGQRNKKNYKENSSYGKFAEDLNPKHSDENLTYTFRSPQIRVTQL